jgi:hypothetical protein
MRNEKKSNSKGKKGEKQIHTPKTIWGRQQYLDEYFGKDTILRLVEKPNYKQFSHTRIETVYRIIKNMTKYKDKNKIINLNDEVMLTNEELLALKGLEEGKNLNLAHLIAIRTLVRHYEYTEGNIQHKIVKTLRTMANDLIAKSRKIHKAKEQIDLSKQLVELSKKIKEAEAIAKGDQSNAVIAEKGDHELYHK